MTSKGQASGDDRIQGWAKASERAEALIRKHLAPTALWRARGLEAASGASGALHLKLENQQPTGSFKVRGAFHKILRLPVEARAEGVVTASTGNHGAAVGYAAQRLGVAVEVVVPEPTPSDRVDAITRFGAKVTRHGAECGASEIHARELGRSSGRTFVSPYNDDEVMAGQGSMALELRSQAPDLDRIYVAVGGGGLMGGLGAALRHFMPAVEIVGCSPDASFAMEAAVAAGEIVEVPHLPTLSLATAGELERGTVTLDPCRAVVDRWARASEDEIAAAMRAAYLRERLLIEGAAGVALAAWMRDADEGGFDGSACVVVCGGNVDRGDLVRVFG